MTKGDICHGSQNLHIAQTQLRLCVPVLHRLGYEQTLLKFLCFFHRISFCPVGLDNGATVGWLEAYCGIDYAAIIPYIAAFWASRDRMSILGGIPQRRISCQRLTWSVNRARGRVPALIRQNRPIGARFGIWRHLHKTSEKF